ncbi:MAG: TIGR02391 family protein [Caldilineaceae bacterium]
MNLETEIKPELWQAIAPSYNTQQYTDAINAAMLYMTEVLRDKSGLTTDGATLVGEALGKKSPKIQINPLQTDTEKSMQAGLESVLRGMYGLVRNPRHHEKRHDDKKTADSIIVFIDHLLDYLGKSKPSFTTEDFVDTVVDEYFVSTEQYVEGLVSTIPVKKRHDVLVEMFRRLDWDNANAITQVSQIIFKDLSEGEMEDYLHVVSDGLKKTNTPSDVSVVIKLLSAELWSKLDNLARMRAEHILVVHMQNAWYNPETDGTNYPAGTWIPNILLQISNKQEFRQAVLSLLESEDLYEHNYVARNFLNYLPDIFGIGFWATNCTLHICRSISLGNEYMKDQIVSFLNGRKDNDYWRKRIIDILKEFTDTKNPEFWLYDDDYTPSIPFLGKPLTGNLQALIDLQDEEIPF